ncbi:MAG: C40 family peptidase [Thermomicrobiales bacterium]|nr:C40 family peptidase [Thermomicrobiales bacterium]MCO5219582.1 C40 family peptidase [Thermomicrobiales bacterium]MCO5226091.1 C40 family peptidase [Thermomicrobiales bacterium]MCO5229318.1 C40 family peptidase [Thermomicrobiales bacterium]
MSSYDSAMSPLTSSRCSRRLFAKRAVSALAASGALLATNAVAQEVLPEEIAYPPFKKPQVSEVKQKRSGQYVVDFALQYLGYRYSYGGNTPGGFDCSGFTQFVIRNAVGVEIGHASEGQYGSGAWVDAGDLQPGDEVFFAGTYRAGVSHTGIYIGDGQFIHAENESTGVCISWLWSDYYGSRYCGANRHW